jgi:copper(I)-binding protein
MQYQDREKIFMKVNRLSSLLLTLMMFLSGAVSAQAVDDVVIEGAYVRAVPPGQPNSAAFMTVSNKGGAGHALVAGSTPAAAVVELHTHTMEGGMMRMREVEKIELPAGETVSLQPGGLHVMLIGLKQKLVPEQTIPLTLRYEDGSEVSLQVPVHKLQMKMKSRGDGQMAH